MMDLQSAIVIEIPQHLAHSWMSDFVDRLAILHLGVNHTEPVLEEGWEITACDITVFVDSRGQHHAAMLAIPCRIIRPSSKKGNTKRGSADDHSSPPVPLESIGHTLLLLGLSMCTLSSPLLYPGPLSLKQMLLDQIAEKMFNAQMCLLNMLGIVARNRDRDVHYPYEAAAVACQGNDAHIGCSRRFYSADDIWRVAAGANAN